MENLNTIKLQKALLLIVAIGLIPIALSYGLMPGKSLSFLFGIDVSNVNLENILRAVMGLYLALIVFWFIGVFRVKFREAALYSMIVFMFGLAFGRLISLLIDGLPHWLIIVYLLLELSFGTLGMILIRKA